jgi:hypothetical protein
MGLYEKISNNDEEGPKIASHTLAAAMREVARGNATIAQLINVFDLDVEDQTDLNAIVAKYTGFTTEIEKKDFLVQIHDAFLLVEAGIYNKDKLIEVLGL